uniref:Rieske domain-containing protein n=1 Tax=Picea sitchensis TaxID=3332 RepID=B8LNL5_PICSI|nr:unknown [Picea sitchensis]
MAVVDISASSCLLTLAPVVCSKFYSYPSSNFGGRSVFFRSKNLNLSLGLIPFNVPAVTNKRNTLPIRCNASEVSVADEEGPSPSISPPSMDNKNWVPVVPASALPKGERRLIRQDGDNILLLWYKNEVVAIENKSPAEGAYSEGLVNAKLTQDGCIMCPTTDSTFNLKTGDIEEWYPNNPVLRLLTPPIRKLFVYPTKVDSEYIYISMGRAGGTEDPTEIVFSGKTQAGITASDVNVEEVRMVVDEGETGFGFTTKNELINGRAAIAGLFFLLNFELLTGKGLLKGTGFLDFLYAVSGALRQ